MRKIFILSLFCCNLFARPCNFDSEPSEKSYSLAKQLNKVLGSHEISNCATVKIIQEQVYCEYEGIRYGLFLIDLFAGDNLSQRHQLLIGKDEIRSYGVHHGRETIQNLKIEGDGSIQLKKYLKWPLRRKLYTDLSIDLNNNEIDGISFKQYEKRIFGKKKYFHNIACFQRN